jgi:hypothetical protein
LSEVVKAPVERPDGERPGSAGGPARRRLDDDWRVEEVEALWPRGLYNHPAGSHNRAGKTNAQAAAFFH